MTVPDVLIGLLGIRGVVRRGCFSASCCRVSAVSGAMLSSEHTARTAPLTSPASIFLLTVEFRDDSRFLAGRLGPFSDILVRPSEELKSVICFLTCAVKLYFFPRVGCLRHCFGMVGRCSHLFASVGSRSSSVSNFWNNSAKDCRAPLGTLFRVGVRFLRKLVTSSLGTSWLSLSGLKFSGDSVVIRRFSIARLRPVLLQSGHCHCSEIWTAREKPPHLMWNHVGHSEHWTPPLWLATRRLKLGAPHGSLSVCVLGRLRGGIRLLFTLALYFLKICHCHLFNKFITTIRKNNAAHIGNLILQTNAGVFLRFVGEQLSVITQLSPGKFVVAQFNHSFSKIYENLNSNSANALARLTSTKSQVTTKKKVSRISKHSADQIVGFSIRGNVLSVLLV